MKALKICSAVLALSLTASTAMAAARPFNGYIVKFKNREGLKNLLSTKSFNDVTPLKVAGGNYAKVAAGSSLAMGFLQNNQDVEYIEPNYIYTIDSVRSNQKISLSAGTRQSNLDNGTDGQVFDPLFKDQWGLLNTGKNSGGFFGGKAGEDIGMSEGWKLSQGSKEIKVAVIDTGVDYFHPDLVDNMWVNTLEAQGKAGVDDDKNGYIDDINGYDFANHDADPRDGHGHGTHCSGVIGASHNDRGIAGVMGKVSIIAVKFLSDEGSGELAGAIEAIDYSIKVGANVMSNSWGGGPFTQSLFEAIERAGKAGIVFTAAAGNANSDNDKTASYPASYKLDNVISVGAFDGKGKKSSFSCYGKTSVHVFAPGSDIISTIPNGYEKMSGTSMATPHISGLVGMLLAEERTLSPKQVRDRLIATSVAKAKLKDISVSNGRVSSARILNNQRAR
jgi:subtilisin family serine protease